MLFLDRGLSIRGYKFRRHIFGLSFPSIPTNMRISRVNPYYMGREAGFEKSVTALKISKVIFFQIYPHFPAYSLIISAKKQVSKPPIES